MDEEGFIALVATNIVMVGSVNSEITTRNGLKMHFFALVRIKVLSVYGHALPEKYGYMAFESFIACDL
jgi:hypothetical protein